MKTKIFSLLLTLFITINGFSQVNLNKYKYVIIPKKFDFLKEKDQYQLNSLTKFLFEKYGFEALMEGEKYPEDLIRNRCLGLKSDVNKDSGLFKTKLIIELKDCGDQVVMATSVGESREKEYARAYNEALRAAFSDIEALNYRYEPDSSITSLAASQSVEAKAEVNTEIEKLKQEIEALKQQKVVVAVAPVEAEVNDKVEPKVEEVEEVKSMAAEVKEVLATVLYAQEIAGGYQLVDSTPKVVYKVKKTGQTDVFFVEGENAIIYKKGDTWIYEYNTSEGLQQKELNIKF
ncbi:hypothetical protein [Gaetbulibacter saemankumensis]|uniref:hypothetical protein n=1 Tax=Gaetbulibacter saemankumensis TaxID=311208 RepID=UPI00041B85E8|nr:hypothetical protein [Gaetbulibacter saemankumensis]